MLTLHSDRAAPMTSKCTAQLLADLGVTRSLSRPQVSDDNPFSEAQFKTLKYHPGFPGRFEDITAAIAFCRSFFPWYNTEHRHAGIAMLTPDDVHHHRAPDVLAKRGRTLQAAWALHPERFVHGHPETRPASRSRLDQPTRHFHNRRNESVNKNRRVSKSLTGSAPQRFQRHPRLEICRDPASCYHRRTPPLSGGIHLSNLSDFPGPAQNQLWVADITYVAIAVGFVYVAVILDAWSRRVVCYAISRSIDARLTIAALKAAIRSRRPPAGCIHHSDSEYLRAGSLGVT